MFRMSGATNHALKAFFALSLTLMDVISAKQLLMHETSFSEFAVIITLSFIVVFVMKLNEKQAVSNQQAKNVAQSSACTAEKLSFIEKRMMWELAPPHETMRQIISTFYEWDIEKDHGP